MRNTRPIITVCLAIMIGVLVTGCNEQAQKKKALEEKWQHNKAVSNIPVAMGLIEDGQLDRAEEVLGGCLKDNSDIYMAHYLMGQICYMRDDIERAKECFETSIKLEPGFDDGWYWLGEIQKKQGDMREAVKSYTRALELAPEKSEYIISAAHIYADQQDYDRAISLLDSKIKAFGNDVSLVIAKADILVNCGRKDEVIKVYEKALLLNGDSKELIESLGYCYFGQREWSKAEKMFERLIKTAGDGKKEEYLKIMSTCCMNMGEYSRALGCLDKVDSDYKNDAEYWLEAGQAALGSQEAKRAVFCANRALFLKPGWGDAYLLLGCGEYMNGRYEQALRALDKISNDLQDSGLVEDIKSRCHERLESAGLVSELPEKDGLGNESNIGLLSMTE